MLATASRKTRLKSEPFSNSPIKAIDGINPKPDLLPRYKLQKVVPKKKEQVVENRYRKAREQAPCIPARNIKKR
jgi:hypothetical protein